MHLIYITPSIDPCASDNSVEASARFGHQGPGAQLVLKKKYKALKTNIEASICFQDPLFFAWTLEHYFVSGPIFDFSTFIFYQYSRGY